MEDIPTMQPIPFIPSGERIYRYPLKRYLPPYYSGILTNWLKENGGDSCDVVDPLGANPLYALEAAGTGYRVFQSQKNPLLRLMTRVAAQEFKEEDFQKAVHILLDQEWHGEKLQEHIHDLYQTECRQCQAVISAEGFVWKKDSSEPSSVVYICPHCGESGIHPIDDDDRTRLAQIGNQAMYRSRAMQRCLLDTIDIKKHIEYALACYTPRALHVLVILFNTLDRLQISRDERALISAVLIEVCDLASSLWYWPDRNYRPHQLNLPAVYFEKNIERALPHAIRTWTDLHFNCEVTTFPVLSAQTNSVCFFDRKETEDLFKERNGSSECHYFGVFPRPNQAFWTLSAVWSAWLFGKKAAEGMLSTLFRQRYGWYWFAQALSTTFDSIKPVLNEDSKVLGLCLDLTPSYLLASLAGTAKAGLRLQGYASQNNSTHLQYVWQKDSSSTPASTPEMQIIVSTIMERKAEPVSFNDIFAFSITALADAMALPLETENEESDLYTSVIKDLQTTLADRKNFHQFSKGGVTSGKWIPLHLNTTEYSSDDRIELEIIQLILERPQWIFQELYAELCHRFPGFLTPDQDLCMACLNSYAQRTHLGRLAYSLDPDEAPSKREKEMQEIAALIAQVGSKLGFAMDEASPLTWFAPNNEPTYQFFITSNTVFSPLLMERMQKRSCTPVILFPASRSRLILEKQRRNPLLEETLAENWHLVKYRHIRKMGEQDLLSVQAWQDMLDADPPLWEPAAQLKLL